MKHASRATRLRTGESLLSSAFLFSVEDTEWLEKISESRHTTVAGLRELSDGDQEVYLKFLGIALGFLWLRTIKSDPVVLNLIRLNSEKRKIRRSRGEG